MLVNRGRPRSSDTIPKLDKIEYLFDTLVRIGEGLSFDELRINLIELRRTLDRQTRRDLRPEQRPRMRALDNPKPETFWANAREAVRELMRLGMVMRAPMPNTFAKFERLKTVRFQLTPDGREFVELGKRSVWVFRDAFFCAMDASHIYLQALRRRLARGDLFIPRVGRGDVPGDSDQWRKGPPEPLRELAMKVVNALAAVGKHEISPGAFETALSHALDKTWSLHPPKGDGKAVSRWVVKLVNEQIVHTVAVSNDIPMDFMTFRHAVSLLSDFHVCWETRALRDRPEGWSIWLTADGEAPHSQDDERSPARSALEGEVWIKRRLLPDEIVMGHLIDAILTDPQKAGGFSLIHDVRARVCHKLGIHGWLFESALRRVLDGSVRDATYDIHIDAGGGDRLPASEEPFLHRDTAYHLITLVKRSGT